MQQNIKPWQSAYQNSFVPFDLVICFTDMCLYRLYCHTTHTAIAFLYFRLYKDQINQAIKWNQWDVPQEGNGCNAGSHSSCYNANLELNETSLISCILLAYVYFVEKGFNVPQRVIKLLRTSGWEMLFFFNANWSNHLTKVET